MRHPPAWAIGTLIFLLSVIAYADSAFERLRQITIRKSPEIGLAQAALHQRQAQVYTSVAHWLPKVDVQLSETVSKDYSFLTNGAITVPPSLGGFTLLPQQVELGGWALRASFPLYRRSAHLNVLQSQGEKSVAESDLQLRLSELDARLRDLFGGYLLRVYKVATITHSLTMAETNRREIRMRYDLEQRTKIDLLRAEANVISLQSKKLGYEQERAAGWNELLEYAGLNEEEWKAAGIKTWSDTEKSILEAIDAFTVSESLLEKLRPYLGESGEAGISEARRQLLGDRIAHFSTLYRSILAQEELDRAKAQQTTAQEWPELLLTGSLYKQNHNWGTLFDGTNQSYSFGVQLTIPIFLGGSLVSSLQEKSYAEQYQTIKHEKDILHLKNEVENEWLQIQSLLRAVESFAVSRDQNEEIVRLAQKSYDLGKTSMTDLLSSQNDLIDAKINFAKSRIDLAVLVHKFASQLGVSEP
jgi:outer membrane protein TolC